jgi:hypothetical protein
VAKRRKTKPGASLIVTKIPRLAGRYIPTIRLGSRAEQILRTFPKRLPDVHNRMPLQERARTESTANWFKNSHGGYRSVLHGNWHWIGTRIGKQSLAVRTENLKEEDIFRVTSEALSLRGSWNVE